MLGFKAMLGLAIAFLVCSFNTPTQRSIYISLVNKDSVPSYFNKLATARFQVVATPERTPEALKSKRFTLNSDEAILLVENHNATPLEKVGKVLATFDNIHVLKIAARDVTKNSGHLAEFPALYSEPIRKSLVTRPFFQIQKQTQLDLTQTDLSSIKIDPDFLKQKLRELSGDVDVELNAETTRLEERGSLALREKTRQYLKQEYEALGYEISEHNYGRGVNFIAERQGTDPSKYLILSAHFDSVRNPGADDDGAGTITVLAIAHTLKFFDLKYNLRIMGFDEEELGLIGSRAYAKSLNDSEEGFDGLIGVVNVEMTAYDGDGDGAFHVMDCNENSSNELSQITKDVLTEYEIDLQVVDACTNRSDHASFWRYDQPAIVLSQNFFGGDSNPCYHRRCDKVDILDFDYMQRLTRAIALTVSKIIVE